MVTRSSTLALHLSVLAVVLLGKVSGECRPESDCQAIRKTVVGFVEKNRDYQNLAVPECKPDTLDWIVGMTDLLPDIDEDLGKALLRLAVVQNGDVVLNGKELVAALANGGKTTLRLCQPLCRLAKSGCGCNPLIDVGTSNLVGGDPEIGRQVVVEAVKKCMEDHGGVLNFKHRIIRDGTCDTISKKETLSWSCG